MGAREVSFVSADKNDPAKFYFASAPAHAACPTVQVSRAGAQQVNIGSPETSNQRTIYQMVHPSVLKSCQLVMGITELAPGSVWNTMPCHTHDRRMEVYFYLDIPKDAVVFHLFGEPGETRHIVVRNELHEVVRGDIEQALSWMHGNVYAVSLDRVRLALEHLPWVRRAEVRRRWPDTLEVTVVEHQAVARWGGGTQQLVNSFGEVFFGDSRPDTARLLALPRFVGPLGTAPELLARFEDMKALFAPIGRRPQQLTLTPRLAWQVMLDDGLWLELGREQQKTQIAQRLQRFVAVYAQSVGVQPKRAFAADLRYPNGFVLRPAQGDGFQEGNRGSS